jgi:hypothetical protein
MTPKTYYNDIKSRCDLFAAIHGYLANHATGALQPDELLRAEWAARVSALDLFVHELVAQNLVEIFEGTRPTCPGFSRMVVSGECLLRIQAAATPAERRTAFDLEVRTKLSRVTYQYPDDIADGIRMISPCKLWNEVAIKLGATAATVGSETESLKKKLSVIVDRRNKIVHEGDLQPTIPRIPWPIVASDVKDVASFIDSIIAAIDGVI